MSRLSPRNRRRRPNAPVTTRIRVWTEQIDTHPHPPSAKPMGVIGRSDRHHLCRVINTWAYNLNHTGLGMKVMHERNAHNFSLYLDGTEATPIALTA